MKHGKQHNILYDLQHGFRDKRSCESQLIGFIDDVVNAVHGGNQTDVIVMDFSKAFDKVSHCLLVDKLRRYGIQGHTNRWIRNWLSDRTQTVVLDGERSYTAGVPQGSVLGPCLFPYNINDIPELYDMRNDPDELHNLAEEKPQERQKMNQRLNRRWLEGEWNI